MLRGGEKAKASGSNQYAKVERSTDPTAPKPLSDLKISKQQSSDWQKLASVPEKIFEKRLADPYGVPSTAEIIRRGFLFVRCVMPKGPKGERLQFCGGENSPPQN